MSEEWKNSIVTRIYKKVDKQKVENYRGISLLNEYYKLYSNVLKEKLKTQAANFLLECQNGLEKGRSCINPLCSITYLQKREESLIWKPI